MKAQELWNEFCKEKKIDLATPYEAWAFGGDDPDGLASLVMRGIKTATASGYDLYELDGEEEEMPKEGEWILIQYDEDCYDTLVLCDLLTDIFYVRLKKYGDIRWAYISDLLPKGGEK